MKDRTLMGVMFGLLAGLVLGQSEKHEQET